MSTDLDREILPEVVSVLEEFGATGIFTTYPARTYDKIAGKMELGAPVIFADQKVIPPYDAAFMMKDDSSIQKGDMVTGIAGNCGFLPEASFTTLEIKGAVWNTVKVKPIYSGDDIALYLLILRR